MKNYAKQVNSEFFFKGNGSRLHIIKNTPIELSPKCENPVIQMQLLLFTLLLRDMENKPYPYPGDVDASHFVTRCK